MRIISLIIMAAMSAITATAAPVKKHVVPVDQSILNIRAQARENNARMQAIEKTIVRPGQGTNIVARAARQSMQERLDESRKEAKKAEKAQKAAEKTQKKDKKNFEKLIDDIKKAKSKSSEEMAEVYDSLLELLLVPAE